MVQQGALKSQHQAFLLFSVHTTRSEHRVCAAEVQLFYLSLCEISHDVCVHGYKQQ